MQNFANPYSGLYLDSMLKILSKIKTENVKFWRDTHTSIENEIVHIENVRVHIGDERVHIEDGRVNIKDERLHI